MPNSNAMAAQGQAQAQPRKKRAVRKWTPEEDKMMVELVKTYGTKRWGLIGGRLKGRTGKQCRERYVYRGSLREPRRRHGQGWPDRHRAPKQ